MKHIYVILISLALFSCKNKGFTLNEEESHMKLHEEMDKVDKEYHKFREQLTTLYKESETNPEKVILKADSLLVVNSNEKDKYKSKIKNSVFDRLHALKAELFYQLGKYNESLSELKIDNYTSGGVAAAYAANYVKLKEYEKAKSFIDSIGKGYYIYDYALGNYYESVGNKTDALKVYQEIKQDKTKKHYAYYKLAVNRLEELQKSNPMLLNEIYYPTGNPSFEIAESDSENRKKIFKLMEELPENHEWAGTAIIDYPQINDKDYYWVRVTNSQRKEFNYYIYEKTFEIKYFDPKTNKLMTLEEWRKSR